MSGQTLEPSGVTGVTLGAGLFTGSGVEIQVPGEEFQVRGREAWVRLHGRNFLQMRIGRLPRTVCG